jgi:hypothetical protein
MVAAVAVLAGVSAVNSIVGGIFNSVNARKRAEFNQKLLEEQIQVNDILYAREIRSGLGDDLVGAAARGVSQTGSVIDSAFDKAFGLQLQRAARNYQLRVQQLQADVLGKQQSQQALLGGIKGALGAATIGAKGVATASKTADAINDGAEPLGPTGGTINVN